MMPIRVCALAALAAASLVLPLHAQQAQQVAQPAPTAPPAFTVVIEHYGFTPKRLVVPQGAIVTWTNRDGIRHDATAVGQWTTGLILPGQTGSITASSPGTFQYKCTVHPDMTGTLVVEAPK
jgi:plastocyanin